jgi:hypothetical protein
MAMLWHARIGVPRPDGAVSAPVPGQKFFAALLRQVVGSGLGVIHVAQVTRAHEEG